MSGNQFAFPLLLLDKYETLMHMVMCGTWPAYIKWQILKTPEHNSTNDSRINVRNRRIMGVLFNIIMSPIHTSYHMLLLHPIGIDKSYPWHYEWIVAPCSIDNIKQSSIGYLLPTANNSIKNSKKWVDNNNNGNFLDATREKLFWSCLVSALYGFPYERPLPYSSCVVDCSFGQFQ